MSKHSICLTVLTDAGPFQRHVTVTGEKTRGFAGLTVSPQTVDEELRVAISRDQLAGILLLAQNGDLTIKTNSPETPGNVITLKDGAPLYFAKNEGLGTNPFAAADVARIFLSSEKGCRFTLDALVFPAVPAPAATEAADA